MVVCGWVNRCTNVAVIRSVADLRQGCCHAPLCATTSATVRKTVTDCGQCFDLPVVVQRKVSLVRTVLKRWRFQLQFLNMVFVMPVVVQEQVHDHNYSGINSVSNCDSADHPLLQSIDKRSLSSTACAVAGTCVRDWREARIGVLVTLMWAMVVLLLSVVVKPDSLSKLVVIRNTLVWQRRVPLIST